MNKRYMLIEYPSDFENILKDKLEEEGISNYFDDTDIGRVVASAATFLHFRKLNKNNCLKLCINCEENEATKGNFCSEDCAEADYFGCVEAQATGN